MITPVTGDSMDVWGQLDHFKTDGSFIYEPLGSLSEAERIVASVIELDDQVQNGGFAQYLFNAAGSNPSVAAGSLEAIGAIEPAELARRAIAVLPAGAALTDAEERRAALQLLSDEALESLDALDGSYYSHGELVPQKLIDYVLANRDEIRDSAGFGV